ncbi:hypothetical protein ACFU8Q_30195 [Streptomyces sp. NPDC057543]
MLTGFRSGLGARLVIEGERAMGAAVGQDVVEERHRRSQDRRP